jgi:hypothetical protein
MKLWPTQPSRLTENQRAAVGFIVAAIGFLIVVLVLHYG